MKINTLGKSVLLLMVCLLPLLVLFCYRIVASYSFDNDFGRDLVDIFAITQGNPTLLGPKLSFGGLHTGPYYYYLFTPVMWLLPGQPEAILYANAALAWFCLVLVGVVWMRLEKWSTRYVLLSLYWIGLSSYYLFSARDPGNAFSYVGWMIVLLGVVGQVLRFKQWWLWGLYGLSWGILINTHLAVLFVVVPLLSGLIIMDAVEKPSSLLRCRVVRLASLAAGLFLSFAPLVLFELTHDFVIFRNTFIDKSYQTFLANGNLPSALETSNNPLMNAWLFLGHTFGWVTPLLSLLLIIGIGTAWITRKSQTKTAWILLSSSIASLLLVALLSRSQLVFHYLFPFLALAQVACIVVLQKLKAQSGALLLMVLISLVFFPQQWYQTGFRYLPAYRDTIDALLETALIHRLDAPAFEVYVTREVPTAPIGFEYRYFLLTHGLVSLPPSAFSQAKQILWIAEQPVDPNTVDSWELREFGPRQLIDTTQIGSRTVYLFAKK